MSDESWVVLVEHVMNSAWVPIDGPSMEMLGLESELTAAGIDVVFDPFRPGEGGSYTRTLEQPIRMLVREADLAEARRIAAAFSFEESG
jgi:hypothetical protein